MFYAGFHGTDLNNTIGKPKQKQSNTHQNENAVSKTHTYTKKTFIVYVFTVHAAVTKHTHKPINPCSYLSNSVFSMVANCTRPVDIWM